MEEWPLFASAFCRSSTSDLFKVKVLPLVLILFKDLIYIHKSKQSVTLNGIHYHFYLLSFEFSLLLIVVKCIHFKRSRASSKQKVMLVSLLNSGFIANMMSTQERRF